MGQWPQVTTSRKIPKKWRDLFALIPGYDPIATAGDCWFDAATADKAIAFFETYLTHIEGEKAGKPFALVPWQAAQVGCAFGWMRPDGTRRYREVFDFEPRKNGKSTKCGGLVNLVAFCDDEPGAQIYSAAADREQAVLVYRQAKGMILNNPELAAGTKIYATFKSIEYPNGAVYKALSADADTKHGFNTHFVVVDELHAQKNRDLVDVLVTSTGSRRQPMVWYITTSDFDRNSICNEKYDYACKVRDGVIEDPYFLPVIYEASPDDDWTDAKVWRKANPNLGVSISEDYLSRECQRAKEIPSYENTFKRLHLNIRTRTDRKWLDLDKWIACNGEVDEKMLEGRPCYSGLDLSSKVDITAHVIVFPPHGDDNLWRVLPRFWIPADSARQRERRDRVPYETWARQGFIHTTPGNVVDYDFIKASVLEDGTRFGIKEIAYDPWAATQIALQLQAEGATVIEFGQGYKSMSEPSKELEKLVQSETLAHGAHPVLKWMASNTTVESDAAGNIKPSKGRSTEKIDGIVSLVMAIGRAICNPDEGPSVYESRGIIYI
jgi:phage terminase large subunit-like protein